MVVNDLRKPLKIPRLIYVAMFAISWTTVSMPGGTTITNGQVSGAIFLVVEKDAKKSGPSERTRR